MNNRPGKVAGVDGCKNGWVAVTIDLDGGTPNVLLVDRIDKLLADTKLGVITVDMPIGFPKTAGREERTCDWEARKMLGRHRSRVFPSPARATLVARDYDAAKRINRKHHESKKSISRQCFHLFEKMREIDALMPQAQDRIRECHPEICFWALNGKQPIPQSKKKREGREVRKAVLRQNRFSDAFLSHADSRLREDNIIAHPDDFLDACAAAWTATRIARGEAEVLPEGKRPRDEKGIRMEMWY